MKYTYFKYYLNDMWSNDPWERITSGWRFQSTTRRRPMGGGGGVGRGRGGVADYNIHISYFEWTTIKVPLGKRWGRSYLQYVRE